MTDNSNQNNFEKSGWLGKFLRRFGVLVAIIGGVWFMVAQNYEARLTDLTDELKQCEENYDVLHSKTDGLLEPTLYYVDTLERSNDGMWAHGGKVFFDLERRFNTGVISGEGYSLPQKIGFSYWNDVDSVGEDLILTSGERWRYSVGSDSFYVTLEILDAKQPKIIGRIYELKPLYRPAP